MKPFPIAFLTLFIFGMFSCAINSSATPQSAKTKIDLENPADNLSAFLKMRGNTDGSDTVMWWSGQIFAVIPQEKPALLFEFEGINVARLVHQPDGGEVLRRLMNGGEDGGVVCLWHGGGPVEGGSVYNL